MVGLLSLSLVVLLRVENSLQHAEVKTDPHGLCLSREDLPSPTSLLDVVLAAAESTLKFLAVSQQLD